VVENGHSFEKLAMRTKQLPIENTKEKIVIRASKILKHFCYGRNRDVPGGRQGTNEQIAQSREL
jgi:hypothetical protein